VVTWEDPLLANEGRVREEDIRLTRREGTLNHSDNLIWWAMQEFVSECIFLLFLCHVRSIYLAASSNLKCFD